MAENPFKNLKTVGKHRFLDGITDPRMNERAMADILALPADAFDRYDNPFERKWALREKHDLNQTAPELDKLIRILESAPEYLSPIFGVDLYPDLSRHYCGVFRYEPGDYLDAHVDAGLHPENGLRKHVTAVLYFGGTGNLEFWDGGNAGEYDPHLWGSPVVELEPLPGRLVIFENNDCAWHGMGPCKGPDPRIVVTVSYLSEAITTFRNMRTRAFFVRRPDESWSLEKQMLREARASESGHKEVYRTND